MSLGVQVFGESAQRQCVASAWRIQHFCRAGQAVWLAKPMRCTLGYEIVRAFSACLYLATFDRTVEEAIDKSLPMRK